MKYYPYVKGVCMEAMLKGGGHRKFRGSFMR